MSSVLVLRYNKASAVTFRLLPHTVWWGDRASLYYQPAITVALVSVLRLCTLCVLPWVRCECWGIVTLTIQHIPAVSQFFSQCASLMSCSLWCFSARCCELWIFNICSVNAVSFLCFLSHFCFLAWLLKRQLWMIESILSFSATHIHYCIDGEKDSYAKTISVWSASHFAPKFLSECVIFFFCVTFCTLPTAQHSKFTPTSLNGVI